MAGVQLSSTENAQFVSRVRPNDLEYATRTARANRKQSLLRVRESPNETFGKRRPNFIENEID